MIVDLTAVLSTWPLPAALVIVVSLLIFRRPLIALIERTRHIHAVGTKIDATGQYNPQPPVASPEIKTSPVPEDQGSVARLPARDFDRFLLVSVQTSVQIIMNILDAIWKQRRPFGPLRGGAPPSALPEKVDAVRNYIDPRPYSELQNIMQLMNKNPLTREDLTEVYRKCRLLIDYLGTLVVRRV